MTDLVDAVSRIEVFTPFPVGNVNCYLLEGSPLTLIDTGPKTSKSLAAIQQGLGSLSYTLSDIEQILLTHSHVDHVGLVAKIARERMRVHDNPPEVWVHGRDAEAIVNYEKYMDRYTESFVKLVTASGVPQNETQFLAHGNRTEFFRAIGESYPAAHSFEDGVSFRTGIGMLYAVWVPGHSPGSTCFVSDEHQFIFSGDHILGDISSNPSISFDGSERISMMTYFDSLNRISTKAGYIALPGHREPIHDIKIRIDTLHTEYADKLQRAAASLSNAPQTVYEISKTVYGNYDLNSLVLALAETHDLLRILENKHQAKFVIQNGITMVTTPTK